MYFSDAEYDNIPYQYLYTESAASNLPYMMLWILCRVTDGESGSRENTTVEIVALCRRCRLPWSEILALLGITSVVTCKWLMLSLDLPRTFTP